MPSTPSVFSTPFKLHKQDLLQTLSISDDDFEPISNVLKNDKLSEEDRKRLTDLNNKAMRNHLENKLKQLKISKQK